MDVETIRDFSLGLPGVTEDMPFGEDLVTFRIGGKIFLGLGLGGGERRFALKLAPERNEALREAHATILPAWHWNKRHWSDVFYENMDSELVKSLIRESYLLVLNSLPRKLSEQYR